MKRSLIILAIIISSLSQTTAVQAITQVDRLHVINDTVFYDEKDEVCDDAGASSNDNGGNGTLVGKDNPQKAFNYLVGRGLTAIQAAGVIGNLMQESHVDPTSPNPGAAGGRGGGIAQWEGDRFTNLIDYIPKYNAAHKSEPDFQPISNWKDLRFQLEFLWTELPHQTAGLLHVTELIKILPQASIKTNTLEALKMSTTPSIAAQAYELTFERAGDPRMEKRIGYAESAMKLYGGSITPSGGGGTGCAVTNVSLTAGGIAGTALSALSWPKPDFQQQAYGVTRKGRTDPTPEYAAKGGTHTNPGGTDAFTDCGTFVATVMHLSGADPKYPNVQTTTQRNYVKSHPELYVVTPRPSEGSLKPGDILISDGHTMIYVGDSGGTYNNVDASWNIDGNGHTPQRNNKGNVKWMLGESGIVSAHYIGKTAGQSGQTINL